MREDPVNILAKLVHAGFHRNNIWIMKYISLVTLSCIEMHTIIGGLILLHKKEDTKTIVQFLIPHCLLQPGCAGLYLGGRYITAFPDVIKLIQNVSSKLYLQDADFETKIEKKARLYKTVSFLVLLLSISNHLLYTPFLINDGFIDVSYFIFKKYYYLPGCIIIGLYAFCLFLGGFAIASPLLFIIYLTFHAHLQLSWLHCYVDYNLNDQIDETFMINDSYQKMIYGYLKEIIKYRLEFRRSFNTITLFQTTAIMILGTSGLTAAVTALSFIICDVNPASNPKIIITIATIITIYGFLCICSQSIIDESTKLNDLLYKCPWLYWNNKNRKALLIMFPNLVVPWEITLKSMFSLDRQAIRKATNLVYSLVAVTAKFK